MGTVSTSSSETSSEQRDRAHAGSQGAQMMSSNVFLLYEWHLGTPFPCEIRVFLLHVPEISWGLLGIVLWKYPTGREPGYRGSFTCSVVSGALDKAPFFASERRIHQGGQRANYGIFLLGDTVHGSLNIPHEGFLPGAPQESFKPNVFSPLLALVNQVWGRFALFASQIWAPLEGQQETAMAGPCSAVVVLSWRPAAWGYR